MRERRDIIQAVRAARRDGDAAILATVVRVAGSTYRRPGARMLIRRRGPAVGLVSGGCLETDLLERAREVLDSGEVRTVVYDMRSPDDIVWGLGLGCEGEVRILLEPVVESELPASLILLEHAQVAREAGTVATVFEGGGPKAPRLGASLALRADQSQSGVDLGESVFGPLALRALHQAREEQRSRVHDWSVGPTRACALVEFVPPPIRLLVFGAGADAVPLVALADRIGWEVDVIDHRPEFLIAERFPGARELRRIEPGSVADAALELDDRTAVALMTHHFLRDLEILGCILASAVPYVGLLGPRRRGEKLREELTRQGSWRESGNDRFHAPLGLDLGAESPEEIALAALAEIQACFAGRNGGFLRLREGPLHDWR